MVYVPTSASNEDALRAEDTIKRWRRAWQVELIERENPTWRDLYGELNK